MTRRRASWIAGSVVCLCVAMLVADYVVAARRTTTDQKKITAARLARKKRDDAVAWVLIAAAAAFLWGGQSCPQPAFSRPGRLKGGRSQDWLPHTSIAAEVEEDWAFVDDAVAKLGRGKESAIPLLQAIQAHYRYLPDEALRRLCELTEITPAEIAGTSSFYSRFRRSPVGEHLVRVCHGTACHVSGARQITDELRRYLAIPEGADTDPARQFTLDEVACLGCCSLAPMIMVDGHPAGKLTPATACEALRVSV
jgi:NADH:ubiquinone oxidoreductase subunit E